MGFSCQILHVICNLHVTSNYVVIFTYVKYHLDHSQVDIPPELDRFLGSAGHLVLVGEHDARRGRVVEQLRPLPRVLVVDSVPEAGEREWEEWQRVANKVLSTARYFTDTIFYNIISYLWFWESFNSSFFVSGSSTGSDCSTLFCLACHQRSATTTQRGDSDGYGRGCQLTAKKSP